MRSSMPTRFSADNMWRMIQSSWERQSINIWIYTNLNQAKHSSNRVSINNEARIRDKGSHQKHGFPASFPTLNPIIQTNYHRFPSIPPNYTPPGLSRFHAASIPVSDTSPQWNTACQRFIGLSIWHVNINSFRNNWSGFHTHPYHPGWSSICWRVLCKKPGSLLATLFWILLLGILLSQNDSLGAVLEESSIHMAFLKRRNDRPSGFWVNGCICRFMPQTIRLSPPKKHPIASPSNWWHNPWMSPWNPFSRPKDLSSRTKSSEWRIILLISWGLPVRCNTCQPSLWHIAATAITRENRDIHLSTMLDLKH